MLCGQACNHLSSLFQNENTKNSFNNEFNLKNVELSSTCTKGEQHPLSNYSMLSAKNKAIARLFERVFSMWEAGKNKQKLFNDLYAFPPDINEFDHLKGKNLFELEYDELAPVNLSSEYADYFLACLVSQAKYIRDISSNIAAANRSRFFLIGDVGSGKTTFLNYIFSKHYDTLKAKKIMWIRIDLTKTYHGAASLNDSLQYQLARIVRKSYYDNEFQNDKKFELELTNQFSTLLAQGKATQSEVDMYISDYTSSYNSERTEPFHPLIQKAVQKYVQERFAMIYIYDGLDRLRRGDDFEEKLIEIQKHILGSEKRKHVYLFVMRTTSHARSLNKYLTAEEHSLAALRKVSKTFTVLPPKLSEVVKKRLVLLCSIWDRLLIEERHGILISDINDDKDDVNFEELQKLMHSCKWLSDSETLNHYYKIFLRFIYRGLSLSDVDDSLSVTNIECMAYRSLKNVVGMNFRILLSVLNYLQRCFLRVTEDLGIDEISIANMAILKEQNDDSWSNRDLRRILARHYYVIKTLLRHRSIYVHPFKYSRGANGDLVVSLDSKVPFIFNIFRGVNVDNKQLEIYHLLAKVRILQLLINGQYIERHNIIDYISNCFGYNKEYLSSDLNELMTIGLITRIPKNNEYGDIYYVYAATRTGINMIETLIFEFSYLEIILNDIFVPKSIFEKFQYDFSNSEFGKNSLLKRLHNLPRIVYFIFLINSVENQEKRHFQINNKGNLSFDENFSIYKKLSESITQTFRRMLKGKDVSLCNNALSIIQSI